MTPHRINWQVYAMIGLMVITTATIVAFATKTWVLTAIPIGILFGFFLQKGDLCGSSAFSEAIMFRDRSKLLGLWTVIVVAMLGFAALDLLGFVTLNPKPLRYISYIAGGIVFGVGMVLAGGCVSGCLYKAGTGNLNSMIALLGIPIGVMIVEFGPLQGILSVSKNIIVKMSDGGVVTLDHVLGIPFWLTTVIIGLMTVFGIIIYRVKYGNTQKHASTESLSWERIMTHAWKPWVAGLAIGLLMIPAYLSSAASGRNYPLGVTHGVMQAELLLIDADFTHVYQSNPPSPEKATTALNLNAGQKPMQSGKKVVWWLVALIVSLVAGSWLSARMSGQTKLLPKPPDEMLFALLGGVMVGIGAAFATGCVVGNIMSGWALLSIGTMLFGIITMLANWVTTRVYLMGSK